MNQKIYILLYFFDLKQHHMLILYQNIVKYDIFQI